MTEPLPAFLTKRGITGVTDNVPAGHEVRVPAGHLFRFFGDELMQRLQEKSHAATTARPGSDG